MDLSLNLSRSSMRLLTSIEAAFDVREFSTDDGLNALFSVDIEAMSRDPAIDFEELVGQAASFELDLDPETYPETLRRVWSGVISEAH
jgi:uncharacterized protein involved in type VI secretion and phage assembly